MKKIAVIGVALGLAIGLAGCSTTVSQKPTDNGLYVGNSSMGGSIAVVYVPHGDRTVTCAVLMGQKKGGLSCDWDNAK